MKKKLLLIAFILLATIQTNAQLNYDTTWDFYKSENGVKFYINWKCYSTCDYRLFFVRVKNESYSKMKIVHIEDVEFYYLGKLINTLNGSEVNLKAGGDLYGEQSGLWWNVPKGYENKSLTVKLIGITVKDK
jgi:hypothetical protein